MHRLWEPLALKQAPPNGYAAKFSTPYCVAVGFLDQAAGLEQFTDVRATDERTRALATRVFYEVDPNDEYPKNFTGAIQATLVDGRVLTFRKGHMRGGANEPLSDQEILAKFRTNSAFGGMPAKQADDLLATFAR